MKKTYLNYLLLIIACLGLILITKNSSFFFGSNIDWFNQHVVFADYLRNLFYSTGNLFPDFAFNLGAGMNIFNLAYYGLYSPFILISYLLPFIPMINYLQILNILLYLSTVLLTYKFLIHKDLSQTVSLIGALLMACATPVLFQFHRQLMFVDYLPFLILGLFGVDSYFDNSKKSLLIITTFLIIMTSYYFSVSGILVLIIYGYYNYQKRNIKWTKKNFNKIILPFFVSLIIGVGSSCILLIPTFFTLISGRGALGSMGSFLIQFLPNISFFNLLYHPYNLGLTTISLISLIYACLSTDKSYKHLGFILLLFVLFPILLLVLNGGLYARGKVLIPFLPLFILLISLFLENIKKNRILPKKKCLLIGVLTSLFLIIGFIFEFNSKSYWWLFLIDGFISILLLYQVSKGKTKLFIIFPILLAFILAIFTNKSEEYISINNHNNKERAEMISLINDITTTDKSFYRMFNNYRQAETINEINNINYYETSIYASSENSYYRDFLKETFKISTPLDNKLMLISSLDPLFMTFMNTKYLVTDGINPIGYELKDKKSALGLYVNNKTLPFAYATDKLINENYFQQLIYPNTIGALFSGVVTKNDNFTTNIVQPEENTLTGNVIDSNITINKSNDTYNFTVKQTGSLSYKLNQEIDNKILMLSFDVTENYNCTEESKTITINGITNQVSCDKWLYANKNNTFHYNLSANNKWDTLNIAFSEGEYSIKNIKTYLIDYKDILKYVESVDPYAIDNNKTKGDVIVGSIEVSNSGYFATSLPYDNNYIISDNGSLINKEKVNAGFIGFPITKGHHEIKIIYKAKGHNIGKFISICFLIITLGIFLYEKFFYSSEKLKTKKTV